MNGLIFESLNEIVNENGNILHFLKINENINLKIGEVYFSEILPGIIKAWKLHSKQIQRICIPVGLVKIIVIDMRKDSNTYFFKKEYVIGRPNFHSLLIIPPGLAYGFKGLGENVSIIANAPDLIHDPLEGKILSEKDFPFEIVW